MMGGNDIRPYLLMKIIPTPTTAALAGVFSALVWPYFWARYGSSTATGSLELVVATLLVIALPAHAFVVGFGPSPAMAPGASRIDTALLKRMAAWLAAAAATAGLGSLLRG